MHVVITQDHIDKGCRGSYGNCPVALACLDAGLEHPWVSASFVNYGPGGWEFSFVTPDDVHQRIITYDKTGFMEPFEFDLRSLDSE